MLLGNIALTILENNHGFSQIQVQLFNSWLRWEQVDLYLLQGYLGITYPTGNWTLLSDFSFQAVFQYTTRTYTINSDIIYTNIFFPTIDSKKKKVIMCDRLKTSTVEVVCRRAIRCIQYHHYSHWGNRYFSIGIKEHNNDSRWTNELKDRQCITNNDQDNIFFIVSSKMSFVIITDQLKFDFLANDSLGNSTLVLLP